MTKTFAETIDERIAGVEMVATMIAKEGRETDLHDLRILLINIMSLVIRNPGMESAADDLYAAAAALVKNAKMGMAASPRGLRILREARERFFQRLPSVSEKGGVEPRFKGLEAAYAVQLERTETEGTAATSRAAA